MEQAFGAIGVVASLWRYPVKSMMGETIDATAVTDRGFVGDRAYALIDQDTGKVASAKNPRRWGVLFECRPEFAEPPGEGSDTPPVRITLPDGSTVRSDDRTIHDTLSRVVGRPVRLEAQAPDEPVLEEYWPSVEGVDEDHRETVTDERIALVSPPGTFFDAAPLHLLTNATLARLAELSPEGRFAAERFRPNVVVDVDGADGFVENDWVGRDASLGDNLTVNVFLSVPRCVMTTLPQGDLPRDLGILQAVARHNRFDIPGLGPSSCVGVYALAKATGTVKLGDSVSVL